MTKRVTIRLDTDGWVRVTDIPNWGSHDVLVRIGRVAERSAVTELKILARDEPSAITTARLRSLPMRELTAFDSTGTADEMWAALGAIEREKRAGPVSSPEQVAAVWNRAEAAGRRDRRRAVCEELSLGPRAADGYIREARRRGLISTPSSKPSKSSTTTASSTTTTSHPTTTTSTSRRPRMQ